MQGTVDGFSYGLVTPLVAYLHGLPRRSAGPALHHQIDARHPLLAAGLARPRLGGDRLRHLDHALHRDDGLHASQETPIHYDKPTTFASLGVAIVMVGIGIFIVGYRGATGTALFTGGTITGLGVASMHYLGMAGMRLNGKLEYNTLTVSASVVIAVVAATAALWAAGQVRGFLWSVGASLVMGLAVSGMHYTGMAALSVHLHGTRRHPRRGLARRPARAHDDRPAGLPAAWPVSS